MSSESAIHAHAHAHGHGHHHHGANFNKQHFNNTAEKYSKDEKGFVLAEKTLEALVKHEVVKIDGARILDFACGPGNLSKLLAPKAAHVVGLDLSESMVEIFNAKEIKTATGIAVKAHVVDIVENPTFEAENADFNDFDTAVCCMAFHHIPDPVAAAKGILKRLKPGGVLCLVELHPSAHLETVAAKVENVIMHHGFSYEQIQKIFEDAGFEFVGAKEMYKDQLGPMDVPVEERPWTTLFLAVGRKPEQASIPYECLGGVIGGGRLLSDIA